LPLIIDVPVSSILSAQRNEVVLDKPTRCSRCGALPAAQFDIRRLRVLARPQRSSFGRVCFGYTHPYQLKLRVCENCRQADYVTHPEEVKHDKTTLGRVARLQSLGLTVGGIIAALGILFNTPMIPALGVLTPLKQNWMYVALAGLVVTLVMWFYQNLVQKRTAAELAAQGYNIKDNPRAEIRTPALEDETDSTVICLEIRLADHDWAKECAESHDWTSRPDPE
jgi:hypothetical protein